MNGCVGLQTGDKFLATTLSHLDCQGRMVGAYGYGALADPNSPASIAITAMLTIFVALFGLRLMLEGQSRQDLIGAVVRVGIVLTLATSWPAWRIIGYNLVLDGPSEIAQSIGIASALPVGQTLVSRLQNADDAMVAITIFGSGRLTGGVVEGSDLGDSSRGVAISDQTGLGFGRVAFLIGVIGPWAIARIGAGILLAIAPLMAGLLLFVGTTSVFVGWVRGLVFVAFSSLGVSIAAGIAISLIDPWATDVLSARDANVFTPAAPTEMMVLGLASLTLSFGMIALAARISFFSQPAVQFFSDIRNQSTRAASAWERAPDRTSEQMIIRSSRARMTADAVAFAVRREKLIEDNFKQSQLLPFGGAQGGMPAASPDLRVGPFGSLGSSFRRSQSRRSAAASQRDMRA